MTQIVNRQSDLRGFIGCLVFDRSDIDDVLQNTNIAMIRKSAEFQPGTDFWAWASTVARFEVKTHLKRQGRNRLVFRMDVTDALAEEATSLASDIHDDRREALRGCLTKLQPAQRQLLQMRYGDDSSLTRISEVVSRPIGSIRQALYRIRRSLIDCVGRELAQDGVTYE